MMKRSVETTLGIRLIIKPALPSGVQFFSHCNPGLKTPGYETKSPIRGKMNSVKPINLYQSFALLPPNGDLGSDSQGLKPQGKCIIPPNGGYGFGSPGFLTPGKIKLMLHSRRVCRYISDHLKQLLGSLLQLRFIEFFIGAILQGLQLINE